MLSPSSSPRTRPDLSDLRAVALEHLDDAVSILDSHGTLAFVNEAWSRLSGVAAPEALGHNVFDFLAPGNEDAARAVFEAALGGEVAWHGELWFVDDEGREYLARCTLSPIGTARGNYYTMVQRDITDFRRAAERQRAYEASFRALIEHSPDGIAVQRDGIFVYVNPAFTRWIGARDVVGRSVLGFVCPGDRPRAEERFLAAGAGESVTPFELRVRCDGGDRLAEVTLIRSHFDGEPALLGTFRDLTERRQLEMRLIESDRLGAIGTLAAGIAHEINTPIQFVGDSAHFLSAAFNDLSGLLQGYRAFASAHADTDPAGVAALREEEEMVDAAYLEENIPAAVQRTLDGVARVATIVRAMKEFGHPGVDEASPADINHALEATLVVARNEIKYVADVETDLGPLPAVVCHLGGLNQVFLNLLVNASHAIADAVRGTGGKGRITVRTRHEGEFVRVSISDTGTGVPESIRSRIFDPFFTTKEVGKGTGQGLAIARNIIVEKHGGRIELQTEVGRGTTFHLVIPVVAPMRKP